MINLAINNYRRQRSIHLASCKAFRAGIAASRSEWLRMTIESSLQNTRRDMAKLRTQLAYVKAALSC